MRTDTARTVKLAEYTPPAWIAETVRLEFDLAPTATRVLARIRFRKGTGGKLRLDGEALALKSAFVDGEDVRKRLEIDGEGLTLSGPLPDEFTWEAEVEIAPEGNTALEGLYLSNGMYCTQCEAEGFRKITYFPDRPDVMATYEVRIEAPKSLPVLLSNGEKIDEGALEGDRHFAEWRDPWPKPSYLFALVAGDLVSHDDQFVTESGREVELKIFVRPGDEDRCAYAMDALKRSMRWDERVYGREYDLSIFMIVAVDDFNMGAMENKGLNIFNSKYVLASPETATDRDYALIEGIIAHEYFHNWTGNRITCRDWFQLCLKEGLTVYRDQQFSADARSHAVQRIEDVAQLRARQFREDAGPLAHPVRPEEYIEINNFYTATVYEKGAEVIGMLRRLIGHDEYRKGVELYFNRHDGQACTIEDWLGAFQDSTGRDLSQFALWYSQAGTPKLTATSAWDAEAGEYSLTLRQDIPATPGQDVKMPMVIPVAYGLLGSEGQELVPPGLLVLDKTEETFTFRLPEEPVPSLLREFSAPVILERETSEAERVFLLANDTDAFNKWEAGRACARAALMEGADPAAYLDALAAAVTDDRQDPAFRALLLGFPSDEEMAAATHAAGKPVDPDAIHAAGEALREAAAERLEAPLRDLYAAMEVTEAYSPDAEQAGRRALRAAALRLLVRRPGGADLARAAAASGPLSEQLPALTALAHSGAEGADAAMEAFRAAWAHDPLVTDKWLMIHAMSPQPDALDKVKAIAGSDDFPWRNPNRFRSLIGAFAAGNPVRFHDASGAGYRFFADWVLKMDGVNPQTAARTAGAFETWRRYDVKRQGLVAAELDRILAAPRLSKDLGEIVGRIRKA
ncbi:aminopeptidase N [Rhodovulum sp. DZ06]|uniref:aminopeptidase N n=1 Tax=Rhodovulum sp. DZ06 TaxID=3425126 RepID=UPI003D34DD73